MLHWHCNATLINIACTFEWDEGEIAGDCHGLSGCVHDLRSTARGSACSEGPCDINGSQMYDSWSDQLVGASKAAGMPGKGYCWGGVDSRFSLALKQG